MRIAIGSALAIALLATAAPAQEEKKAGEELIGAYVMVEGESDGTALPEDRVKGQKVRITADTITTVGKDDKEIYVAKYKLDTTVEPYKITMKTAGGPEGTEGKEAKGVIEIKGDTIRLCYASEGGVTPTEFKTKAGDKQNLFKFKREEK